MAPIARIEAAHTVLCMRTRRFFPVVLLAVCSVFVSTLAVLQPANAIVNGDPVEASDVPFIARLTGGTTCGASFLSDSVLVTAAHCVADVEPETIDVVYGLTNYLDAADLDDAGRRNHVRTAAEVEVMPHHGVWPVLVDDVAIIRLDDPALPGTMRPVPLYNPDVLGELTVGTELTVSGWGALGVGTLDQSPTLNQTSLPIIEGCDSLWVIDNQTFCGLNNETSHCGGDSGGPATVTVDGVEYLAGIVSFGVPRCPVDRPAGYADVSYFYDWIAERLYGFGDVNPNSWQGEPVRWMNEQNITKGCDLNLFCPDQPMTREQQITFLYRYVGEPVAGRAAPFTDLSADRYYSDPVAWAFNTGVTEGIGGGEFGTGLAVTRGQAVTFLWRHAGEPVPQLPHPFVDVPNGRYFTDAVSWAAESGITEGISPTEFGPDRPVTRAQFAAFLFRFDQLMQNQPS